MSLLASFGTTAVAAHAAFGSVARFISILGDAIGFAMVAVIGQCIVAGEKNQARKQL